MSVITVVNLQSHTLRSMEKFCREFGYILEISQQDCQDITEILPESHGTLLFIFLTLREISLILPRYFCLSKLLRHHGNLGEYCLLCLCMQRTLKMFFYSMQEIGYFLYCTIQILIFLIIFTAHTLHAWASLGCVFFSSLWVICFFFSTSVCTLG